MRIRHLRLRNINSLHGDWSIDFDAGEYRQEGLFLISGPTGSGKTSILDSIALALYGETPRCSPSQTINDFMSRDAADCMAEAVFETARGRFTVVWSQGRTKNAKAPFQAPLHKLYDSSGHCLAEKKTQTLKLVIELTGLDFSQFKRAVLLAQREFDAFLTAGPDEKAAILEKLTDTAIYGKLSQFAHQRWRDAEDSVARLESALEGLAVLNGEECASIEAEIVRQKALQEALSEQIDSALKASAWHEAVAKALEAVAAHEREKESVELELAAFAPGRAELDRAKICAALEPGYARLSEMRKQAAALAASFRQNAENLDRVSAREGRLAEEQANAVKGEAECSEKLKQSRPMLEKARQLDAAAAEKEREIAARKETELNFAEALRLKTTELEILRKSLAVLDADLGRIGDWLLRNKALERLETGFAGIQERLKQWEEKEREREKAELEAREFAKAGENFRRLGKNAEKDAGEMEKRLEACVSRLAEAEKARDEALAGWTLDNLKEHLKAKSDLLLAASVCASLDEHRANLDDGAPCPLCGSLEHPYALGNVPQPGPIEVECRRLEARIDAAQRHGSEIAALGLERQKLDGALQAKKTEIAINAERGTEAGENRKKASALSQAVREQALGLEGQLREDLAPWLGEAPGYAELAVLLERKLAERASKKTTAEALERERQSDLLKLAALEAEAGAIRSALEARREETARLLKNLAALKEARGQYFDGQSANKVEQDLEKEFADARKLAARQLEKLQEAQREAEKIRGALETLGRDQAALAPALSDLEEDFARDLRQRGLFEAEFLDARRGADEIRRLEEAQGSLDRRRAQTQALLESAKGSLDELLKTPPDSKSAEEARAELNAAKQGLKQSQELVAALQGKLEQSSQNSAKASVIIAELDSKRRGLAIHKKLADLIGGSRALKFRRVVQRLALAIVLQKANAQLAKITDRYALMPARTEQMGIEVADYYQAGEIRSVKSLSGGETFQICLALALGLSSMAGNENRIDSLFMDEGFGSLDSDTLETAIAAIDGLREEGKMIGIISHVEALKERIGVQIAASPKGQPGRSVLAGPGVSRG